jgi:GPH family glycoside/pentoside/hexuronide:cation symporter
MTEPDQIAQSEVVSLKTKFNYGISNIGSSAVSGVFATTLIFYYVEKLLLSEIYIIWAFILYAIWNAINDPLFGWLSDKTSTKWGRRIPYLILFSPIMAISFFLVWISPSVSQIGELGVFLWMLFTMLLYDTAFTAALLVYSALGQELSMDHRERAKIQIFAMVMGITGNVISIILPPMLLEEPGIQPFLIFIVILSIIQFVTMWITAFTVKERLELYHGDKPLNFYNSLKHTIKSKSFVIAVLMNFCMVFVSSVLMGNLFFYFSYAFEGIDQTIVIIVIFLSLLLGILSGVYYIVKQNEKKGLKSALLQSIIFLGLGLIVAGIMPGLLAGVGFYIIGIGLFGVMSLVNTAFGEVADEDEVKTGTRREAAIFGVNAFITKPAQSVAGAFIAVMLVLFSFVKPINGIQQAQSDFTILGIKLAIGIIPGIVFLGAALVFNKYPLYGEYLSEIKAKMYKMHEEKRKKYISKDLERSSN